MTKTPSGSVVSLQVYNLRYLATILPSYDITLLMYSGEVTHRTVAGIKPEGSPSHGTI